MEKIFGKFIGMLLVKDYNGVRADVCRECNVSDQTFRYWQNGQGIPKAASRDIINKVAARYGYEAPYKDVEGE